MSSNSILRTLRATIVVAVALVASMAASPAEAKKRCTPAEVYADWYDGRFERTYPVSCLRAALRNAPEDLLNYGGLPEDLQRAIAETIRKQRAPDRGPDTSVSSAPSADEPTGATSEPSTPKASGKSGSARPRTTEPNHRAIASDPFPSSEGDENPFESAANRLGPGRADAVPIPLLVIAALALLLLAAAAASFVARRIHARRVVVREVAQPPADDAPPAP